MSQYRETWRLRSSRTLWSLLMLLAALAADGRSVSNALGFPGIFRGALDTGATAITDAMTKAAALTLAGLATNGDLLPDFLDRAVHRQVAAAVGKAARASGVEYEIVKVTDLNEIIRMGAMMTPGLAIDGELKSAGKVLSA